MIPVISGSEGGTLRLIDVEAVDGRGAVLTVEIIADRAVVATQASAPTAYRLYEATPNPFNPSTRINY
jgi:hypothetical protein